MSEHVSPTNTDPHGVPAVQEPPTYHLSGWGPRAGAFVVDRLVTYLGLGVFGGLSALAFYQRDVVGIIFGVIAAIAGLLFWAFYAPGLVARSGAKNGQTWGKQMMGIRAVRNNGKPFDFGQGLLREGICKGFLPNLAGAIIPLIPTVLNFLWPLWDEEKRAVHDMIASSHVVDSH